jgi:hypothetical protein
LSAAVARRIAVAVRVARIVPARLRLFDAHVDGAGAVVAASDRLARHTAGAHIAPKRTIAVDAVVAARVIRLKSTTSKRLVAAVDRAFNLVVTLAIVATGTTEGGVDLFASVDIEPESGAWPPAPPAPGPKGLLTLPDPHASGRAPNPNPTARAGASARKTRKAGKVRKTGKTGKRNLS